MLLPNLQILQNRLFNMILSSLFLEKLESYLFRLLSESKVLFLRGTDLGYWCKMFKDFFPCET